MAKFYGEVGYGATVETAPGVWRMVVTERKYFGDVLRNVRRLTEGDVVNKDLEVNNSISILADAYANEHFHQILYVNWGGTAWEVSNVEVNRPRLNLRLKGVYNGEKPAEASGDSGADNG